MPVGVNSGFRRVIECVGLSLTFSRTCGSRNARPACVCDNGDVWRHPYYISQCAYGGNPKKCTCPNGTNFPVQN